MAHRILFIILLKIFGKFERLDFQSLARVLSFIRASFQAALTGTYTLPDIGLILEKLMGHGYRSNYTRRRFRMRYATTCKQPHGLRHVRIE